MANGGRRGKVGRKKKKRKAKYLSLSRHLIKAVDAPELESSPRSSMAEEEHVQESEEGGGGRDQDQQQQVEAFALHPEPSTLFAAAPSLTDILGASSSSGGGGGGSSCGASPGDISGGTGRFAGEEEDLARRALRGRERWVYCGSASSPSSATTTTTTTTSSSCSSAATTGASQGGVVARSPLLKLDYEEVLAAWAGRGSLYIGGGVDYVAAVVGHAVPKLELDSVFVEVGPSHHAAAWSAPVTTAGRAERVRRYKEKRQARLFSKRIRYEVRRLNAVRRPRLKGRFIKENEGAVAMAAAAGVDGGELEPTPYPLFHYHKEWRMIPVMYPSIPSVKPKL